MIRLRIKGAAPCALLLTLVLTGAATGSFNKNQKAFYADANASGICAARARSSASHRPGSPRMGRSVRSSPLTDPKGAPLDRTGINDAGRGLAQLHCRNIPQGNSSMSTT